MTPRHPLLLTCWGNCNNAWEMAGVIELLPRPAQVQGGRRETLGPGTPGCSQRLNAALRRRKHSKNSGATRSCRCRARCLVVSGELPRRTASKASTAIDERLIRPYGRIPSTDSPRQLAERKLVGQPSHNARCCRARPPAMMNAPGRKRDTWKPACGSNRPPRLRRTRPAANTREFTAASNTLPACTACRTCRYRQGPGVSPSDHQRPESFQ